MSLRSLPLAARLSLAARFILASLLLGALLLISANTHAAKLDVSKSGSGTVTSAPSGINCGTNCSASYASGTKVTLTASAATGYSFSGWGGACNGTSVTCMLSITAARRVTTAFSQNVFNYVLTVNKSGSGTMTSSPAGISCGTSCSASYTSGTSVTLTASAATGYSFSGWNGACSGTGTSCTVSMTAARSVTATFSPTISSTTTLASDTQCTSSGLAATDLSDQCRSSTPTPGAFEAIDPSTLPIHVTWSPYPGTVSGYIIYYGPTSTTATNLASDVPIGTANFDPAAPAVDYQAQDLGLSSGNAVCFQIFAYDTSHALYNWSEIQCTVVY
jgi:uncharacterized repeat protein (TIGR02543 family)